MIESLKQLIVSHGEAFHTKGNLSLSHIHISKFFHGSPHSSKKILFFASQDNIPLCIVKMSRKEIYNDYIEREINGLNNQHLYTAPKLILEGTLNGLRYFIEEVISGAPVGQSRQHSVFPYIAEISGKIPKGKKITVGDILALFTDLTIQSYPEFDFVMENLQSRKKTLLALAHQHGDMTYKNMIIREDGTIVVIDWENFDMRPIWCMDAIHYLLRMVFPRGISSDLSSMLSMWHRDAEPTYTMLGLTKEETEAIFFLDWFFDILQKDHPQLYSDVTARMKHIWSL